MELHPSEAARESVRLLVGPLPPDAVPDRVRRWLETGSEDAGLGLEEVRWLRGRLAGPDGASEPLRNLLAGGRMELPSPVTPARNPELEARCQRLRAEQEERTYRRMVQNVDPGRLREPSLQMGKQMREVNAQLVEVGQVVFSVGAAFLFGYMAAAVAAGGSAATSTRILVGLAAALVVLIAEGYFLLRYLSYADDPSPVSSKPAGKPTSAVSAAATTAGVSAVQPTPPAVKKDQ